MTSNGNASGAQRQFMKHAATLWRWRRGFLVVIVVGLAFNAIRLAYGRAPYRSSPAVSGPWAAYTVRLKTIRYRPDAAPKTWWEETHALRGDGAFVRKDRNLRDGRIAIWREISLPTGVRIVVDDVHEFKTTMPDPAVLDRRRNPANQCFPGLVARRENDEILAAGEVQGIPVLQHKLRLSVDSFAPSLGCALLYARRDFPETGYEAKEMDFIKIGEPDGSLFELPTAYQEVPPSRLGGLDSQSERGKTVDRGYTKPGR